MKETYIKIAVFPVDAAPYMTTIESTLDAQQKVVEGLIQPFRTRIKGVTGICNEEAINFNMPFNPCSIWFGQPICGPFFLCREEFGSEGIEHASLNDDQARIIELSPAWPGSNSTPDVYDLDLDDLDLTGDPWG